MHNKNLIKSYKDVRTQPVNYFTLCYVIMRSFPHLQRDVALKIVDDFIEEIAAGLIQEQSAKIHGFGSFEVVTKKEQVRKIEKNRNFVIVPARRRVIFKAGKNLLESMNASQ